MARVETELGINLKPAPKESLLSQGAITPTEVREYICLGSEEERLAKVGLFSPEEGERLFPSIRGHETNRRVEMELGLATTIKNGYIDSKDHRVVQSLYMKGLSEGKFYFVEDKSVVDKTWPQFWNFIDYVKSEFKF